MKKWQKRTGIGLLIVLILAVVFTSLVGDYLIKQFINTGGPKLLGVPVHLESVTFRPILGHVALKGLRIGNPAGFKSKSLFEIGRVNLRVRARSMLSNKVVIKRIEVVGAVLTYERNMKTSNLDQLLSQMAPKPSSGEPEKPVEPARESKPSKKIVIKELIINGTRVNVALTALGGHGFTLALPPIHLSNIGDDEDGATFAEAMQEVFGAVLKSVTNAVSSSGKMISSGAENAIEGIKSLFK
jgi:uncharacterized protein involved in outer membrane biogenesis